MVNYTILKPGKHIGGVNNFSQFFSASVSKFLITRPLNDLRVGRISIRPYLYIPL